MKTSNENSGRVDMGKRRPAPLWLYYGIAIAIAFVSVRLFISVLVRWGIVAADDGDLVMLVALPVSLLVIGRLAPRNRA